MARQGERSGKERFWRGMLARWERTRGQSIRAFCDEHGLSEQSFYAWRRTIAERDRLAAQEEELPTFVPLRVAPATAPVGAGLEVVVGSEVVRVPSDFDAATLRRLLAVLREETSC
jgi:transposase-like protein